MMQLVKKEKTLSLASTIMLTVYSVIMFLAWIRMLILSFSLSDAALAGSEIVNDSIKIGNGSAAGGMDYALPGILTGGFLSVFGGIAWVVILVIMITFLAVCVVYVAVTVVSYLLIKKEKYKADAWAKIVLFGITFWGLLIILNPSGMELVFLILLTGIPILLSVIVLFTEKDK